MRKAKKTRSQERAYSYVEYVLKFYPKTLQIPRPFAEPDSSQRPDPGLLGVSLAHESIKKAKRALEG